MTLTKIQSNFNTLNPLMTSFCLLNASHDPRWLMNSSNGESEGEVTKTEEDKPLPTTGVPTVPRKKQTNSESEGQATKTEIDKPGTPPFKR